MPLPEPSRDNPALITGASSGIGEALARDLAARGYSLILVARRQDRLEALAEELTEAHDIAAEVRVCDLIDRDALDALCDEAGARKISILCNNAGFVHFGEASRADPARLRDQVQLNVVALQALTLAVLKPMRRRGSGGLLAVGSMAGHQPLPRLATYSATKAFVNTFYEALHQEIKKQGVHCTVLAPGPVRTEITQAAGREDLEGFGPDLIWISAERAAREALDGLFANRRMVTPGVAAKVTKISGKLTPRSLLLRGVDVSTRKIT